MSLTATTQTDQIEVLNPATGGIAGHVPDMTPRSLRWCHAPATPRAAGPPGR